MPFGLPALDRLSHLHIIGQTGTGKSTLLQRIAAQDAASGIGFCLVDPHGDLAEALHSEITAPHLYWDLADPAAPYGYNPVTRALDFLRPLVAAGLIEALRQQWADAWGARMEHILRYTLLALLEQSRADLRDVMRLLLDKAFRNAALARITDPQERSFWTEEYPAMSYKTAADGVAPIANKIGSFLAHPLIRRAVCSPDQPLRFRRIMYQGDILIVNLAKGRIGSDSANVMGGLLVSALLNAAFSRHDLPEAERRPFFLLIDEFHNFTTAALATMLPEARKYRLGLVPLL